MNNIEKSRAIPQYRFPEFANSEEWEEKVMNELLNYERPDNYIVSDTNYNDRGTPVLTANKSFVLGYTNETEGVYQDLPAIIFDDFTVDKKYVDFPFKVKSSAIKILKQKNKNNLKFVFELMNTIRFDPSEHKRYYISVYQNLKVAVPKKIDEQNKIADCLSSLDNCIEAEAEKLKELKIHKKGLMQKLFPVDDETIPQYRFPEFVESDEWEEKVMNELLNYERPDNYIVSDTNYNDRGTPVLTANKSFVLGYTNETEGVYQDLPAIIFDDFTVDKKYVDFPFKVKSSAIKILKQNNKNNLKFVFELMNTIQFDPSEHKRYYISVYQNLKVAVPKTIDEQNKIADCLTTLDNLILVQAEKIEALKLHKKGLMQGLFPTNEEENK